MSTFAEVNMKGLFLGSEEFTLMLANNRYVHVAGRYGSGKTMFAVGMSALLVSLGYADGVVCNFPCILAPEKVPVPLVKKVVIIDEASRFIAGGKQSIQYTAFLRKYKQIYILPSVFAPHPRLCNISVERVFNGYVMGLPFWLFDWRAMGGRKRYGGKFVMWRPLRLIGTYDTEFIPDDDNGIMDAELETEKFFSKKVKNNNADTITKNETSPSNADNSEIFAEMVDAIHTNTAATADAAENIKDSTNRLRRRR